MKDLIMNITKEEQEKYKMNTTMISKRLKEYNKELVLNLSKYREERDSNNRFLSSYRKLALLSDRQKSCKSNSPKTEQFNELRNRYTKINYIFPDDYLKRNMFKRSPLLINNKFELNGFCSNESETGNDDTMSNDKVVKTLSHFHHITCRMIHSSENGSPVKKNKNMTFYNTRRYPHVETNYTIVQKKSNVNIQQEIKKNQRDINKLNQLILIEDLYNEKEKDLKESILLNKKLTLWKKHKTPSNTSNQPLQGEISDNTKVKDYRLNKSLSKFKDNKTTSSTTYMSFGQNSTRKTLYKPSKLNQSRSHQLMFKSNKKTNATTNQFFRKRNDQGRGRFALEETSTLVSKNNTGTIPKSFNSNNVLLLEPPSFLSEESKTKIIRFLYDKVNKDNNYNPHYKSVDALGKIFPHNESSKTRKNSNGIVQSMKKMRENLKKTDIPKILGKLHQNDLTGETSKNIQKISKLDRELSSSGKNMIKYIVKAKMTSQQ